MSWLSRVTNVFRQRRLQRELEEELRFHVEARAADLLRSGEARDPAEASAQAARRLGAAPRWRDASRDVKLLPWLDALLRDVRYGARMLRRDAVVSGAAIASLGLAIGACTAAFSLVDALILRPLPVRDPDRLVYLTYSPSAREATEASTFNYPWFEQLRDRGAPQVSLFVASTPEPFRVRFPRTNNDDGVGQAGDRGGGSVAGAGDVDDVSEEIVSTPDAATDQPRLLASFISGDGMSLLGLRPALGRLLTPDDDRLPGAHPVVVISHSLWTRRFAADPAVLGRWLTLGDRGTFRIVGVGPAGFTGIEPGWRTDIWAPAKMWDPRAFTDAGMQWHRIWGRLQPGVSIEAAAPPLQARFTDLRRERAKMRIRADEPAEVAARYINVPLHLRSAAHGPSDLRDRLARPLWILSLVAGLVLLIACSNVANLLIARAAARGRELALRVSLGAGRARLVQQMLVESSLLAIGACVLGLVLAQLATPGIVRLLAPAANPAYLDASIDWRLLAFVAAAGLVTTLLFGLAPAWRARSAAPIDALKAQGARVSAGMRPFRALIAAQVGFSAIVLFLAGLFVLSFQRIAQVDPGFEAEGLLLVSIEADAFSPRRPASATDDGGAARAAIDALRAAIAATPGVEAVSFSPWSLFSGSGRNNGIRVPGRDTDGAEPDFLNVSPGFLQAMRIPLLAGRDFTSRDLELAGAGRAAEGGPPRDAARGPVTPAIVNEAFARHYFPGESPIGRRFTRVDGRGEHPIEIVGLAGNAKYYGLLDGARQAVIYEPLARLDRLTMQVRTGATPAELLATARTAARRAHPALQALDVTRQATLVQNSVLRERLLALLSGFFALVALLLAAVGLYGVLSYAVIQRTREIGIRLALGARRGRVVRALLGEVGLASVAGLAIGLGGGLALSRVVTGLLFEVRPWDAMSLAAPAGCLAVAAILAAMAPAWRAARVDPLVTLRVE